MKICPVLIPLQLAHLIVGATAKRRGGGLGYLGSSWLSRVEVAHSHLSSGLSS